MLTVGYVCQRSRQSVEHVHPKKRLQVMDQKNQAKAEVGQKICIKILNIFNLSSQSM